MLASAFRQRQAERTLPDGSQLNSAYRYLRVQADKKPPALLVLGYVVPDQQGDVEVWYSAKGEVVKTRNGRLAGTAGLQTDWIGVRTTEPPAPWATVTLNGVMYERLRDERPGYKDNIKEKLQVTLLTEAALQSNHLVPEGFRRQPWRWFSESVTETSTRQLPMAVFAWGKHRGVDSIVYSRQCLTESFCLELQAWPPEAMSP